jgi:hypothetical protein
MESGSLFNSGFLGASFNWWVGQIPDDSYWRGNINPETYKSKEEIPGWGYRYKVRIIGLHDREEETILSDQLPWAQVMYPITAGGGQGGSMQTPNIRQGMFVFGFFLDGDDQQVPVIMGVLGNNTQTKLASTIGINSSNYAGTSGVANRSGNDGKGTGKSVPEVSDSNLTRNQPPPKTKPTEESAGKNPAPVASQRQDEKLKERITLSSPCKEQNTNLKNIQITIEELSKKLQQLTDALSIYSAAASSKVSDVQKQIGKLIDEASDNIAKCLKGIFDQVEAFAQDQLNKMLKTYENISIPSFKLKILNSKITGFETLSCLFNNIAEGLLGLAKNLLRKLFGSQISNIENQASTSLIASPSFPFTEDAQQIPPTPSSIFPFEGIEGSPALQTFTPIPACVTETFVGEILAENINPILNAIDAAIAPTFFEIKNSLSSYGESISIPPQSRNVPRNVSSTNRTETFINSLGLASQTLGTTGNLNISSIVSSMASSLGVGGADLGPIVSSFQSGNIAAGFSSLAQIAGVDPESISGAISLLNGGNIVGGLTAISSSLGIPANLVGSLSGAVQIIQQGQLPNIFSQAIDFNNLVPGINLNIPDAISFISSILGFFGCDPKPICPVNDNYSLYSGGSTTSDAPTPANIAKPTENKLKEKEVQDEIGRQSNLNLF